MNTAQVLVRGELTPEGTLVLEETPPLPAGPVEVLIRALPPTGAVDESWWDYLQRSRAEMLAQGQTFRTKEEIDADRARARTAEEERRRNLRRSQPPPE
jgi:hypothetical protein